MTRIKSSTIYNNLFARVVVVVVVVIVSVLVNACVTGIDVVQYAVDSHFAQGVLEEQELDGGRTNQTETR